MLQIVSVNSRGSRGRVLSYKYRSQTVCASTNAKFGVHVPRVWMLVSHCGRPSILSEPAKQRAHLIHPTLTCRRNNMHVCYHVARARAHTHTHTHLRFHPLAVSNIIICSWSYCVAVCRSAASLITLITCHRQWLCQCLCTVTAAVIAAMHVAEAEARRPLAVVARCSCSPSMCASHTTVSTASTASNVSTAFDLLPQFAFPYIITLNNYSNFRVFLNKWFLSRCLILHLKPISRVQLSFSCCVRFWLRRWVRALQQSCWCMARCLRPSSIVYLSAKHIGGISGGG